MLYLSVWYDTVIICSWEITEKLRSASSRQLSVSWALHQQLLLSVFGCHIIDSALAAIGRFSVAVPTIWNSLPYVIRNVLQTFSDSH